MLKFKVTGLPEQPFNLEWWKPTQIEWAPVLLKDHEAPWRSESDPTTGRPWAPLSRKYGDRKQKKWPGAPILRASGAMQDGAVIQPWQQGFRVQTTSYGAYHQFGTSKMPARPWVGIPDKSLEQIVPISWKNILPPKD
jgi:hypothetical protein